MLAVAIDDILVAANVQGIQNDTKAKTGSETRPYRNVHKIRPPKPKERDWEERC